METITFYSYKGGVGRSLMVANVAKYLAQFGSKVFAIDFDLEAPGLHHKLALDSQRQPDKVVLGLVDYLSSSMVQEKDERNLENYVVEIGSPSAAGGSIHLMPAGSVPSADYWRTLSQINWHQLFYGEGAPGVSIFVDLKERIRSEFQPDFLLIDARTGITEIGGVATTILADTVVCLMLNNQENLEGARAVLRGIKRTPRLGKDVAVQVWPVLARMPMFESREEELLIADEVQSFLNEPAENLEDSLEVPSVVILHTEEELQLRERLHFGGQAPATETPLLRDYLRLFATIFRPEIINKFISPIIGQVTGNLFGDPDATQRDLEALATLTGHPDAYRALLRLYRVRNLRDDALRAASRLWEMTNDDNDTLVWEAIQQSMEGRPRYQPLPAPADFVEAVWRGAGGGDLEIGKWLLSSYSGRRPEPERVLHISQELLDRHGPDLDVVVTALSQIKRPGLVRAASDMVEEYASLFVRSIDFQLEWARVAGLSRDPELAAKLLEHPSFDRGNLEREEPMLLIQLLQIAGKQGESETLLDETLTSAAASGRITRQLVDISRLYIEQGRLRDFELRVRQFLPPSAVDELLEDVKRLGSGPTAR